MNTSTSRRYRQAGRAVYVHEVADIFHAAGPAYRLADAGHLSLAQLKVITAIENCRTAAFVGHVEDCEDRGHWRIAQRFRSENILSMPLQACRIRGRGPHLFIR